MSKNSFEKGSEIVNQLTPNGAQKIMDAHGEIAPDLAKNIIQFVFGETYGREGLDLKTKQMLTLAALTTIGYAKPQLAYHMKAALNIGITQEEIIDIITHLTPYAGFPAALTALSTAKEVFQSQEMQNDQIRKSQD